MSTASQSRQIVLQPRIVQTDGIGRLVGCTGNRDEFIMEQNEPLNTTKVLVPPTVSGTPTSKAVLEGSLVFDKASDQLVAFDGTTWIPASRPTWTQVLERGVTSGNFTPTITNDQHILYTGGIRLGNSSVAPGAAAPTGIAVGGDATASNKWAVAIGQQTTASAINSIAMGAGATASHINTAAIHGTTTDVLQIKLGDNLYTTSIPGILDVEGTSNLNSVNIDAGDEIVFGAGVRVGGGGLSTAVVNAGGIGIGQAASAQNVGAVGVGNGAVAVGLDTAAFGTGATALFDSSTALGQGATTTANNQVRLGVVSDTVSVPGAFEVAGTSDLNRVNIDAGDEIYFGAGVQISPNNTGTAGVAATSVGIGGFAQANGDRATGVGYDTIASFDFASAFGNDSQASALRATALGHNTRAPFASSTAVGASATTTAINQVRLGTASETVSVPGALDVELDAAFHQAVVLDAMTAPGDTINRLTIPTHTAPPTAPVADGSIMVETTANKFYFRSGGNWISGSGSVTSVALAAPAEFTVSGSPVTGSGTLTLTKATQAANLVWAGPTAAPSAAPTFRGLVWADLPVAAAGASHTGQVIAAATTNQQLFLTVSDFDTGGIVLLANDIMVLTTDSYWLVEAFVKGNDNGTNHAGNTVLNARIQWLDNATETTQAETEWGWKAGQDSTFSGVISTIVKTGSTGLQAVWVDFDNNTAAGAANDVQITNYKLRVARIG